MPKLCQENCSTPFYQLVAATNELEELKEEISRKNLRLSKTQDSYRRIKEILETKRGELKLADVIESESERKAEEILTKEINTLTAEIEKLDHILAELNRDLKKYRSKERKDEIESYYSTHMYKFLENLEVRNQSVKTIQKINTSIKDTGSDQPRALLAYFYAFIKVAAKYGTGTLCPIVIDSPNQQDQDPNNLAKMFQLIFDERPKNLQLILGTVSLHGVSHIGIEHEFTHKDQLLLPEKYEYVSTIFRPYIDQIY